MADAVLYGSYLLAGLVLVAYVMFVRWRWRAEKQKKAENAAASAGDALLRPRPSAAPVMPAMPTSSTQGSTPVVPAQPPTAGGARTVAEAMQGITMPCNLAPLVDVPPIANAIDRAAFVTGDVPFEVVSAGIGEALGEIGYTVEWTLAERAEARRDDNVVQVAVRQFPRNHGYNTAPEPGVVVDLWIETT